MWYVYCLRCKDNSIYTGITNDLNQRVDRHNQGQGCKYTAYRRPVKLVYQEKHPNKSAAAKRESCLKGLTKSQKEELVSAKKGKSRCSSG
ncbi:MAG TPA: GIY-YIG nuclease family protein [Planctomycetota bacterium]|nr:GIY-YIG nuclease family protein [Planctomycetota bacterium]